MGTLSYIALITMLRLSGQRTLSKMSAFDLIVTIALGSTIATATLSKDTVLLEGITALGLFIILQMAVSWLSVRSPAFRRLTHAEPILLLHQGEFLWEAMRKMRITEQEVRQALREEGIIAPEKASGVVLETNGKLTVIH